MKYQYSRDLSQNRDLEKIFSNIIAITRNASVVSFHSKSEFLLAHCKYLHLQYISTMTLEIYPSSGSGVQLQDVDHYISSTSISHSADVLQFKYILSVVLYTV